MKLRKIICKQTPKLAEIQAKKTVTRKIEGVDSNRRSLSNLKAHLAATLKGFPKATKSKILYWRNLLFLTMCLQLIRRVLSDKKEILTMILPLISNNAFTFF